MKKAFLETVERNAKGRYAKNVQRGEKEKFSSLKHAFYAFNPQNFLDWSTHSIHKLSFAIPISQNEMPLRVQNNFPLKTPVRAKHRK